MTNKKLKELILYLVNESKDDNLFGATKLNKLLFDIDFQAYALFGASITGEKYVRRPFGPVPYRLPVARDELVSEGRLKIEVREHFRRKQYIMTALENPDLSIFSKDGLDLVDEILHENKAVNGSELSSWTHTLRPWLDAEDGEEIPYYTVFILKDVPVSHSDLEWGQNRLTELRAVGNAV